MECPFFLTRALHSIRAKPMHLAILAAQHLANPIRLTHPEFSRVTRLEWPAQPIGNKATYKRTPPKHKNRPMRQDPPA